MNKIYKEYNRRYLADPVKCPASVYSSELYEVKEEEFQLTMDACIKTEKCGHSYVIDSDVWPYYSRNCAICGLGLV